MDAVYVAYVFPLHDLVLEYSVQLNKLSILLLLLIAHDVLLQARSIVM